MYMRHIIRAFLLLSLLPLAWGCSCKGSGQKPAQAEPEEAIDTTAHVMMRIQQCSRLYTAEYQIHKIVTHDDVVRLKGNFMNHDFNIPLPLGDRKIAIPMDATLKAYIDFSGFSEKNIERQGDKITILLPDPQIVMTSSKINQQDIKTYVGLTRAHFSDKEMSNYEQQGRQAILESAQHMGIIHTAQENAARVLVPMLTEMGYKEQNIVIAFRHDMDIKQLFNSSVERR